MERASNGARDREDLFRPRAAAADEWRIYGIMMGADRRGILVDVEDKILFGSPLHSFNFGAASVLCIARTLRAREPLVYACKFQANHNGYGSKPTVSSRRDQPIIIVCNWEDSF